MNNKKEQERNELHKTIWRIANDLRGSVDGWDFKQYVLGLLFYRFISENLTNYINEKEKQAGNNDFDYSELSDEEAEYGREALIEDKGFYILPSQLFKNLQKRAEKDQDLNITLKNIFNSIENSAKGHDSEDDVKGLFDDLDVNSNKLGNTVTDRNAKLVKMINAIGDLPLGNYKDNTIDLFGDAYEYLMTMYASNAGKSGGEFFTPQEVGELLAKIVIMDKKEVNKVYDPCCGSGGLLLKFAKILGDKHVKQGYFGQEINITTYNLARINMFLHDINYNKFDLALGDTLEKPKHWDDEPFDAIVSNPPYSIHWAGKSNPLFINDERFSPAGILAPKQKADWAFTMHMLSWLSEKGTAAIVEFPGALDRSNERGEPGIRKYLVENNFIDAIILMPQNLFFGTTIDVCILVLKKNKRDNNILFVDASKEYVKDTKKNKLSNNNIENIIKILQERKEIKNKSVLIPCDKIDKDNYNLSVNRYLTPKEEKITVDVKKIKADISIVNNKIEDQKNKIQKLIKKIETNKKSYKVVYRSVEEVCDTLTDYVAAGSFADIAKNVKYLKEPDYAQLVRTTDLKNGFKGDKFIYVTKEAFEYLWRVNLNKDSIILPNIGNCGEVYFVTPEMLPYKNNVLATNAILLRSSTISNKYLKYVFESKYFQKQLDKITSKQGQTKFNKTNLKKLLVPIIEEKGQLEVIDILDELTLLNNELKENIEIEKNLYNDMYNYYKVKIFNIGDETNG